MTPTLSDPTPPPTNAGEGKRRETRESKLGEGINQKNLKRMMVRDGMMRGRGLMMKGRGFMFLLYIY